jgi:hypothetical protein
MVVPDDNNKLFGDGKIGGVQILTTLVVGSFKKA